MKRKKFEGTSFDEYFNWQMQDPEFRKSWEEFQPEFQVMLAMADARSKCDITQKQLSKLSGIDQSEISKIENGERNPSVKLLGRLANAMGMELKIQFVPKSR